MEHVSKKCASGASEVLGPGELRSFHCSFHFLSRGADDSICVQSMCRSKDKKRFNNKPIIDSIGDDSKRGETDCYNNNEANIGSMD